MAHFDLIDWDPVALEVVKTIRMPVYDEPWLLKGIGKRTAKGKKGADSEFDRRTGTRGFNEELSRYYQLPENQGIWACPGLLRRGKRRRDHFPS